MSGLSPTLQSMTPLSDEELVARVVAGDTPVFELLMRRHNQRLFRIARAIVPNNDEAEDIVQEAYVRAYSNLAKFEGRSSVVTWLSRIALHEALRRRRGERNARVTAGLSRANVPREDSAGVIEEPGARAEMRAMLTSAVDALPAGLRAIVMLRLVEGLGTRETAECLRITEANVKVSLHRARGMLSETIRRRMIPELRDQFGFDGERCDRIVAGAFRGLEGERR